MSGSWYSEFKAGERDRRPTVYIYSLNSSVFSPMPH